MSESESSEDLLRWLRDTLQDTVRHGYDDLTLRQLAILLMIYGSEEIFTVRRLAAMLNIARPTVSRALDRLCSEGLARRQTDPRDRRSILVRGSQHGALRVQQLRSLMRHAAAAQGVDLAASLQAANAIPTNPESLAGGGPPDKCVPEAAR